MLGTALVEIHGQHDDRALVDAATHRRLLDAFGDLDDEAAAVARLWNDRRAREEELAAHRADVERAQREADWLRHAVEELRRLSPEPSEETALAERRTAMMQVEKVAGDLREAHDAVAGSQSPVPTLASAVRRLERRTTHAPALIEPAVKAFDTALTALDEARAHLEAALASADHDPRELERIEERLFALRAAGAQIQCPGRWPQCAGGAPCRRSGTDRRRCRAARRTRESGGRSRRALSQGRGRAIRQAPQGGSEARQGGQRGIAAAAARARDIYHRDRHRRGCSPVRTGSIASSSGCRPIPARGRGR